MPCFDDGPDKGSPDYREWAARVEGLLNSFIHVVDFYYRVAGIRMPQPKSLEWQEDWLGGLKKPCDSLDRVDTKENEFVLRQIVLHLGCDDVDVPQLNDIRNYLAKNPTPKRLGYAYIAFHCFHAMRWGVVDPRLWDTTSSE